MTQANRPICKESRVVPMAVPGIILKERLAATVFIVRRVDA